MGSGSSTDEFGLFLQYDAPLTDCLELVQHAERKGITEVWQSEHRLGRDAVSPTAAYATVTDDIKVGLGVINNWTRNVALIAQTVTTLSELAGRDRVLGGVGAWWDPLASSVGIDRTRPLRTVRETVETVRRLLDGRTVSYDGEFVSLDEVELAFDHHSSAPPANVPVYVGATGFTMMQLTGEFADGCLGPYLVSTEYNRLAHDALETGADRRDRDPTTIDRSQIVACAMADTYDAALDAARRFVIDYYGPKQGEPFEARQRSGIPADIGDRIRSELGGWPADEDAVLAALDVVPEDVVNELMACGTPEMVRESVATYADTAFCECPVLYPVSGNPRAVVDAVLDPE